MTGHESAEVAAGLRAVTEHVTRAQEVLAGPESFEKAREAERVLVTAEDLLASLACEITVDGRTAQMLLSLRDRLAGYLLAAEVLTDIDLLGDALVQVLRKGADEATAGLGGIVPPEELAATRR